MATGVSGGALSACEACRTMYREAERLVSNGTFQTVASLSTSVLCSVLDVIFGTPGIFGRSCHEVAKRVLNYLEQNGFRRSSRAACSEIGLCAPPWRLTPWGWKSPR